MSQLVRDIDPKLIGSLIKGDGKDTWIMAVEALFGSRIADDGTGQPDTLIQWDGVDVLIQTSIDDGRSWQTVAPAQIDFTQRKIPGLDVGRAVTNLKILVRAFLYRDTSRLVSIRTRVALENGDVFDETAANADLETPGPTGVRTLGSYGVVRQAGRVRVSPEHGIHFGGQASGVRVNTAQHIAWDGPLGEKSGTNLSRGGPRDVRGHYFEEQRTVGKIDPGRFARAAFAWEAWVYFAEAPTAAKHILFHYATTFGEVIGDVNRQKVSGCELSITNTGRLRFDANEYRMGGGTSGVSVHGRRIQTAKFDLQGFWVGQWHHVCMSYDGQAVTLHVDGSLHSQSQYGPTNYSKEDPPKGIVIPTDGDFTIGNHGQTGGYAKPLGATLTEVRLWDRSQDPQRLMGRRLSALEAEELHDRDGLVACWPMTYNGDDITPNAYHLDLRNGPWPRTIPATLYGIVPPRTRTTSSDPPRSSAYWDLHMMDLSVDTNAVRLCTGNSPITIDGNTYAAAGGLLSVGDTIRERGTVDPDAAMTFTLTGLDPQFKAIAMRADYYDRPIRLYLVTLGEHGQMLGDPYMAWEGRMDQMVPLLRTEGSGTNARNVLTIGVRAESNMRDFARPSPYRWNAASHRAVYPDDAGFDEVADVAERQELWPRQADLTDEDDAPQAEFED